MKILIEYEFIIHHELFRTSEGNLSEKFLRCRREFVCFGIKPRILSKIMSVCRLKHIFDA